MPFTAEATLGLFSYWVVGEFVWWELTTSVLRGFSLQTHLAKQFSVRMLSAARANMDPALVEELLYLMLCPISGHRCRICEIMVNVSAAVFEQLKVPLGRGY